MTRTIPLLLSGALLLAGTATAQQAALPKASAATIDAGTARAVAEHAATLLEQRYVFPATGRRYAAALRTHAAAGDYAGIATPGALADRLTGDLQAVARDGHVHVFHDEPVQPTSGSVRAAASDRSQAATGIIETRWAAPGVAYIAFDHFDDQPAAIAALQRFLVDYASARALVIDSRANRGGSFDMMGVLANHLFATPRLLANMDISRAVVDEAGAPFPVDGKVLRRAEGPPGLVRFQHWSQPAADNRAWFGVPVYYLTSHRTFSAAEHMAMVLKSSGRATLIGEATGGGNHFGSAEPIGAGLELFVPIGHTTDPATGRDWEGVGVLPDVAVPSEQALDEALRRIADAR